VKDSPNAEGACLGALEQLSESYRGIEKEKNGERFLGEKSLSGDG